MKLQKSKNRLLKPVYFAIILLAVPSSGILLAQENRSGKEETLIWADEFEGTGVPDPLKWERQEYNRRNNDNGPDGWWSKEDSYLDGNGNVVIRVRKIADKNGDGDSCDYSVGALRTKGKFEQLYGKFEIRCKLPTQPGWWVAFWMMQGNVGAVGNGGVDGTEVDIMEAFGWTNKINYAFHWDGYGADHKSTGKQLYPSGIREGFHTFAMEWYPEMYIFYIDGEETWRSVGGGVCTRKGYIKVTGEISTESWAINNYWSNDPADAVYPDSFIVDYVRVYEVGDYQYPAGSADVVSKKACRLYPNPGNDLLYLSWEPGLYEAGPAVSVLNPAGQLVKSFGNVQNNSGLPVSDLEKGFYIISLEKGAQKEFLRYLKL